MSSNNQVGYVAKLGKREIIVPYINSSAIDRIEWDNGTLSIWFRESDRYDYSNVPQHVYNSFLAAGSKGTFYNYYIKDQYS